MWGDKANKRNEQNINGLSNKMLGFINKDVLSVKIISAAKQNTARDPKLLSDSCQQMLLREAAEPRGQE